MKTIQIKIFQFTELSPEAQRRAINDQIHINDCDFDLDDVILENADTALLEIANYDLDKKTIEISFLQQPKDTALSISENHGEKCYTRSLVKLFNRGVITAERLLFALGEEYLKMLQRKMDYKYSDAGIIETIAANEWEFFKSGEYFDSRKWVE